MAESSYATMTNYPIAVIGSEYCTPNQVDVVISRKVKTLRYGEFVVSDMNGILCSKLKMLTEHSRWNAFKGESTDEKDFLFTMKTTSIFHLKMKTELVIFLANNNSKEKNCDYLIKGNWTDRSCVIYAGDPFTIVAQMQKKITAKSLLIGKDNFMVTMCPNIDQAFIVSLIVVLDAINAVNDAAVIGAAAGLGVALGS
ncbi:hypothetical protein R3W88_024249 [Solanum pinnatisectum]|uniref:Uncharacterized protein n=1 Tax=Solanum pinnatisectum TaxID=50273 RepID=A0AAV9LZV6_9SOLN|nr:hypothetical protein R3W88_024249 [Solanum pinnatisectum]